ncbi:MAG: DUF1836 domain-containing protein [Clostridium sp.]|nr:DUF1836 domain-containing protein [Clostridium sp.]
MNLENDYKINEDILKFKIPRWEDLPQIDLYMDQLVTFIENELSLFPIGNTDNLITPSMVNNYVKLNLIPRPEKKKYDRTHIAYLITIIILKEVFTIQQIKDGILTQTFLYGEKKAYNLFCDEQEKSLKYIVDFINLDETKTSIELEKNVIPITMATLTFASKVMSRELISSQKHSIENQEI